MTEAAFLHRRLATFRRERPAPATPPPRELARRSAALAERLAAAIDADVVVTRLGTIVRRDVGAVPLVIDRARLGSLPGQPPPDVPLVCLDTETTGLATAAGTMAFLVGLGSWEASQFRVIQLLLPDQSNERALLAAIAGAIPPNGWLVTYNGRTFDWPLLTTRFRMSGEGPPVHAGHLDLLPFVRRVFRHRMTNARLRSVESELLGLDRHADVEGWEIPGRYLEFLRGGPGSLLADVARHNDEDVVSLARLLAHVERGFAARADRATSDQGDLAGLARAFARERRLEEALECLDAALRHADPSPDPFGHRHREAGADDENADRWWLPRRRADFGGRPRIVDRLRPAIDAGSRVQDPWTRDRIEVERARVLRRLGQFEEAAAAWERVAASGGTRGVVAWIEVAKLREHRLGDVEGAFDAVRNAWQHAERSRVLGRPLPHVEADLIDRGRRLRHRLG
jgi:tetratricopeptide (TPR) repeat protein